MVVGHVAPEAAVGGNIALIKNGDLITIDADELLLQVNLTNEELSERRKNWKSPKPRLTTLECTENPAVFQVIKLRVLSVAKAKFKNMIISKPICFCVLFFLASISPLIAQPGNCSSVFNYFRTCQSQYATEDFVFIAKVSDRAAKTIRVGDDWLWKISFIEVIPIKGGLKDTNAVYLDQTVCEGSVETGKKYIFTAHHVKKSGFSGLASYKWSTSLDDVSENELAQMIQEIRSVTIKEKQPSVTGKVVEYNSDSLGIYDFRGKSLATKLGYDPTYASPLKGITVIAKNNAGEVFEALTDDTGKFEFEELATGNYEIYPIALFKMSVESFYYYDSPFESRFRSANTDKNYFYIRNETCGDDIRFNVKKSGAFEGKFLFHCSSRNYFNYFSKANVFEN